MLKKLSVVLLFTALYNLVFFHTSLGIGTGLLFVALQIFFYLTRNPQTKNFSKAIIFSILSIVFAFLVSYRSNEIVTLVNILVATLFSSVALFLYKSPFSFTFSVSRFLMIPLKNIYLYLEGFFQIFKNEAWEDTSLSSHTRVAINKGLLIGIPTLVILVGILSQADPIFEKFTFDFINTIFERLFVSIIVFVFLISAALIKVNGDESKIAESKSVSGKIIELSIIILPIIALFGFFIALQFQYLFSNIGERQLMDIGIKSLTYSEYVRRGFFELIIASSIASAVVLYAVKYLRILEGRDKLILQVVGSLLTLEIFVLVLSALQRLNLYQLEHGLTRARIFGFEFLVWLSLLLGLLLIFIWKKLSPQQVFSAFLVATLGVLFTLSIINIDGLIATKFRPTVNKEIDYYYINSLSSDAHLGWKGSIEDGQKIADELNNKSSFSTDDYRKYFWADGSLKALEEETFYLITKYGTSQNKKWQNFNLSEYLAYQYLINHKELFEKLPQILMQLKANGERIPEEIKSQTSLDRDINPPLTD